MSAREWVLEPSLVSTGSEAENEIKMAQAYAEQVGLGTLAEQLLRSESIASSQIEGISVPSHRTIAKVLAGDRHHPQAQAALANIAAVKWFYSWAGESDEPFSVDVLQKAHRQIASADRYLAAHAGEIRRKQSWIGKDPHTPIGAEFIPPPPGRVRPLLEDLCEFLNRDDFPVLSQAAIAHAQFETIHPFVDGNGRVGRALIGAVLRRRGLTADVMPPISLVLARHRDRYIEGLTNFRFSDAGPWLEFLALAAGEAAMAARRLAEQVSELQDRWREQAGRPRTDSSAEGVIRLLPAHPILTIDRASILLGRSDEAARVALNRLAEAGVIRSVTVAKRVRAWESVGLFALIDEMERSLSGGARGSGETRL